MRANLPRVAERLGVDRDHRRRLVVLPELEQVVARHVGLVAERHEPRRRQLQVAGQLQQGAARACPTASRSPRCRAGARTSTSAACRATSWRGEAMPMLPGPMMRSPLRRALATIAGMSTSGTSSTLVTTTAPRTRLSMHCSIVGREQRGGDGDHRQADVVGDVGDAGEGRHAADRGVVGVDRVDAAARIVRRFGATARRRSCPARRRRRSRRSTSPAAGAPSPASRRVARGARRSR